MGHVDALPDLRGLLCPFLLEVMEHPPGLVEAGDIEAFAG